MKILDQIPLWRRLRALPDRLAALEERVQALERLSDDPPIAPGEACAGCGHRAMRRTSSTRSATPFGDLGARDEVWTCANCGATETRLVE
ncbi:MAG: hypothetical protein H5U20_02545 [Rhodobacteraceae bacterium]|nr:hypothetical protein [Paracoccaceae bacterium]